MKTLYISDLDGTLFNKSKKISIFTADVINKCIEEGMLFSVATARMPYGCDYRLKDIHMTIPGILTNGVFLYDFKNEKYVSVENIGAEVAKQVVKIFKDVKLSCQEQVDKAQADESWKFGINVYTYFNIPKSYNYFPIPANEIGSNGAIKTNNPGW